MNNKNDVNKEHEQQSDWCEQGTSNSDNDVNKERVNSHIGVNKEHLTVTMM